MGKTIMDQKMIGEITEIYIKDGSTYARVLVDGSYLHVPLYLLMHAQVGDQIVIDAGIAVTHRKNRTHTRRSIPARN